MGYPPAGMDAVPGTVHHPRPHRPAHPATTWAALDRGQDRLKCANWVTWNVRKVNEACFLLGRTPAQEEARHQLRSARSRVSPVSRSGG